MKFGYGLISCQAHADDRRSEVERYRDAIELAVEAETLGFDSVWVSEHHFVDDGYLPSVLPMCAAIAARTSLIEIGTAVALAPLYEPLRLAEDSATVDLISNGRFILGLGQGWRPEEFEALHVPLSKRPRVLEDTVTILRQAWSGGVVTGGDALRYPGVSVRPKPARPGGLPIWIGATAKPAVRRAGRIADGFISSGSLDEAFTPEYFRRQMTWIQDGLQDTGRPPGSFTTSMFLPTFVSKRQNAWEQLAEHMHYTYWKYADIAHARGRIAPPDKAPPPSPQRTEALRASSLAGTPDEVVEKLGKYQEAAGIEFHYIARLYWPGMNQDIQREAMQVFAAEVIPKLHS